MNLLDLGFGPHIQRSLAALERPDLIPARVVREDRGRYHVDDGGGPRPADLLGRLRLQDPITWPAVGDWVALAPLEGGPALVHEVLPRRSAFIRGQAGRRTAPQCVAANVDTPFLYRQLHNLYIIVQILLRKYHINADIRLDTSTSIVHLPELFS